MPSGRGVTVPVTRTTYSLRTSTNPATTAWTTPESSRTSRKRGARHVRALGDPATHAHLLAHVALRSATPQSRSRIAVASMSWGMISSSSVVRRRVATVLRERHGAGVCSKSWLRRSLIVTSPAASSSGPTEQGKRAPGTVGRLHLGLHRTPVVGAIGGEPGARSSSTSTAVARRRRSYRSRRASSVRLSSRGGHALGFTGEQDRSMPLPKPMPLVGLPPSSSANWS